MKKQVCTILLATTMLALVGCGKKEQVKVVQESSRHPLLTEIESTSDELMKEPELELQMADKELFSSIQIGNTVVEMPITYDKLAMVDGIQMFTDSARTIQATETFLIEAGESKEVYCTIFNTNFVVTLRNNNDTGKGLKDCDIRYIKDVDGPDVVFPGNIQITKTDLLTLKEVWGEEISHKDSEYVYYGKTYSWLSSDGETPVSISGNSYHVDVNPESQVAKSIYWKVNNYIPKPQEISNEFTYLNDDKVTTIKYSVENSINDGPSMARSEAEVIETGSGNEYVLIWYGYILNHNDGRNDRTFENPLKYIEDETIDYVIDTTFNENRVFDIAVLNDTQSFLGGRVHIGLVNTDKVEESDLDDIMNHIIDVMKTTEIVEE